MNRPTPSIHIIIWGVIFAAIFCSACQQRKDEPDININGMTYLLTEFHLADAIVDNMGGSLVQRNMQREDIIDEILESNDIDRDKFYDSYRYYLEHPVELDTIYSRILKRLQFLQDSLSENIRIDVPDPNNPERLLKRNPKNEAHKKE